MPSIDCFVTPGCVGSCVVDITMTRNVSEVGQILDGSEVARKVGSPRAMLELEGTRRGLNMEQGRFKKAMKASRGTRRWDFYVHLTKP
jgi:hypothetical protein